MKKNLLMYVVLSCLSFTTISCDNGNKTVEVNGITISATDNVRTIKVDETLQLTAIAFPEGASQDVAWSSSDSTIASVNDTGLVTALAIGNVNIIATSKTNANVSQSYALIVEAKDVVEIMPESITISANNDLTSIKAGETLTLTATVLPTEANQSVNWSSSDETIATVSRGEVTGLKEGSVTITATSKELSTVSASYSLTIEKSDDPILTKDWPNMDYTAHATYVDSENDLPLKVKGIVTHIVPSTSNEVSYYIQDGTEGYYVYNQDIVKYPVELGKSYVVGGFKKYYRGLSEIVNVEYFVEAETACSYTATDVSTLDVSSKDAMKPYHASYVSADAVVSKTPSVKYDGAYSVSVTINSKEIDLRIDNKNMSADEFSAINTKFSTAVVGSKLSFKGVLAPFGYSASSTKNQIQILKSNELEFSQLSNTELLNAAKDALVITSSVNESTTNITLPTTISSYDNVSVSWASDNELINV